MKKLIRFYKDKIKSFSSQIKATRSAFKSAQRANSKDQWRLDCELAKLRHEARYIFLGYARIRGRDLETVEQRPHSPHDPAELIKQMAKTQAEFKKSMEVSNG